MASLVAQTVKRLPAMWETWVQSLGREDPLEKEMATHSSTLAWKIPWVEEPGRLQSMGSQRVSLVLVNQIDEEKNTQVNISLLGYILQPYHVCVTSMFYFGFTIFNRSIKTLFLNTILTQLKNSSRISIKFPHSALIFISKKNFQIY